jgi:hypothetical protein
MVKIRCVGPSCLCSIRGLRDMLNSTVRPILLNILNVNRGVTDVFFLQNDKKIEMLDKKDSRKQARAIGSKQLIIDYAQILNNNTK